METQTRVAGEVPEHLDDNIDAHEKKSMFHNVKDRVRKLNAKVKKNIKSRQGHHETHEESGGDEEEEEDEDEDDDEEHYQDQTGGKSDENVGDVTKAFAGLNTNEKHDMPKIHEETPRVQNNPHILNDHKDDILSPREETMKSEENTYEDSSHSKETEQGRGETVNAVPITEMEETETKVVIPSIPRKAGEAVAEPTESGPQDKVSEVWEGNELASNTKPPNVTEEVKSGGPPETAPGIMSKASGLAQGFKDAFTWKQSSNVNVKDTELQGEHEGIEDGGLQQQQSEAGAVNANENLEEFGSRRGPNSGENPEEEKSQRLSEKAQDKFSDVGEGNELASDTKPPNVTEEVKSGASETGPGFMSKASGLGQGLKDVFTHKQTNDDNVKDSVLEAEHEGKEDERPQHQQSEAGTKENLEEFGIHNSPNSAEKTKEEESQSLAGKTQDKASEVGEGKEDKGTQQHQSEAEAKAGQSYTQKLYAAKAAIGSKFGYGGQTNQENNVTRELKSDDPIQGPMSGTVTEAAEGAKESKKNPVVSKLSPGEDEKALSQVITDRVSNTARSVKDTIVGGFYGGKAKPSTTTDTTTGGSQSPLQSPSSNASGGKGIVGRVTGVVGSFVGRKQGEDGKVSPSSQKQERNSVVQAEEQMAVEPPGKSELQT